MFFFDCQTFLWNFWEMGWYFGEKGEKNEPQATKKFFDPAIFQKCWRGSGRVALIAARRQRNPCAMLLAHGGGGEKSESFSRRRTRPPRLVKLERETSILQLFRCNSCNENALQKILLLGKTVFSVRQKGVPPLLLPTSVLQLPRCLVRIYNLTAS